MGIYPVLILMAGIVSMDTTSGPQILVSEPIVSCSVLGLLFGSPETGLLLGIMFQLLWLGYLPLGGTLFTDNNMAAYIATASLFTASEFFSLEGATLKAALIPAMFLSVFISIIGLHIQNLEQRMNGERSDILFSHFKRGEKPSITLWHSAGICTAFLKGIFMAVIFIPIGTIICGTVHYVPITVLESMSLAPLMIFGTATASAIIFFWTKSKTNFLILGLIGGFTWVLFKMM